MDWNQIEWVPRQVPLAIECGFASGEASLRLARRLLSLDAERRAELRGVCGDGVLVVLGNDLPWSRDIQYLGRPVSIYPVLWPTSVAPKCSETLLARALLEHRRKSEHNAPYAVIPEQGRLVSLAEASSIEREELAAWVKQQ